ncbi:MULTISPECIES: GNAT family N-acetyltransferase [Serratia]|jgi:GNAT superfamily N-acetyltransferase|uniref:Aminoalkylphosphonic acid N-acetyltransferase n=2 Tax=Serratia TaxID=613 RepID=A0A240BKR5_SERFI|nr:MULTISPECIES: GNAT family N-acetyltransferase [Serratia]REF45943.1 ribosomal protein S18 acetylase RimI-like enzyme [Serratia ficaria]USV02055.1 GNAT family N-acetyltransferase [Serratia entomophila]CAI0721290.1 aminoalkylphosphonic acid N-acetyltransferase [Serratia entomophila]CAI0762993.1 aminoalkylphosphonic acid N-acetyltransferase [Serratia entomophila]CAI0802551.1 aminoalkylphosphonic acid N-acetyltransferase [Serratia entomophila]
MEIRNAVMADREAIAALMAALDYAGTEAFIEARLAQLLAHPDEAVLVAADEEGVLGVLSLHFLPQLALAGDICRISYFCVDDRARGAGVGQRLLAEGEALARRRGCDRLEVHCHSRRERAHAFYQREGFFEAPKYFAKLLSD